MKAVILCAGFGTKLYPITSDRPKQLLPVGDRPILDRILDRLQPIDRLDQVYIVTNERFYPHFQSWFDEQDHELQLELVNDGSTTQEERLGAIRDIEYVIDEKDIQEDLLVIAGDNLLEFELTDFVSFSDEHGTSVGIKEMEGGEVGSYSIVQMADDHRIVDFQEKPAAPRQSTISIGLYLFKHKHLIKIREYLDGDRNPDEPGYLIQWLHKQVPVYGFRFDGPWYDIGDITSYNEANAYFEQR